MWKVLLSSSLLCLGLALVLTVGAYEEGDGPFILNPSKTGVGSVKCTTKDNRTGVCVDYTLCYENGSIIKYAEPDIFELRIKDCPGSKEWCCIGDIITEEEREEMETKKPLTATPKPAGVGGTPKPDPSPPPAPPSTTDTPTRVQTDTTPGGGTGDGGNTTAGFRTSLGCGRPADGLRQLSSDMMYGECPWCVALFRSGGNPKTMNTNGYFCTGSLIHPQVVLTAANCVKSAKDLKVTVRIGDYDLSQASELFPHQEIDVRESIVHETFNTGTKMNNIALLVLSRAAQIRDNVNTACLPRAGEPVVRPATCLAGGWGRDQHGNYRDVTAKVAVSPTDRTGCQNSYRAAGASKGFVVDESSFCADASPELDACPAHHGSPLVCASEVDKLRFVQFGLNSWNLRCGPLGTPGIYTDLAALRPWIDKQMEDKSFDTKTYTLA